jgi:hypothetical protein
MGYMFLKKFNKMVAEEDLEKWNKLHEDFNKRMKKLSNEFQIEMFERYEMPTEEILRNAACVLCSTLPNEDFLFFDEIQECRKNMYHKLLELTIKMGLNNVLLCYTAFLLEKLQKTTLKYYIFNRFNLPAFMCICFVIVQKFHRDFSIRLDCLHKVFGWNLKFLNKLEQEILNKIEYNVTFPEEEYKKYYTLLIHD